MKANARPWDDQEPVTDALDRHGLRELFDLAIQNGLRAEAVSLLISVGVSEMRALLIIEGVWPNTTEYDRIRRCKPAKTVVSRVDGVTTLIEPHGPEESNCIRRLFAPRTKR